MTDILPSDYEQTIERLERELAQANIDAANETARANDAEAQCAVMRTTLATIQSVATDYLVRGIYQHELYQIQTACVQALSTDAGKKVLEVVRAAEEMRTNGAWTNGEQRGEWKISREVYDTLSEALSGLGWEP